MTATLDGTQEGADATTSPQAAPTSEAITREQLEAAVRKARSDALADFGRVKKAADEAAARLARYEKERDEAELSAVGDDPQKLAEVRARQQSRQSSSELERLKQELAERDAQLAELRSQSAEAIRARTVAEMASKHGVDAAILERLAKRTDGTAEAIEELAQSLPKAGAPSTNPGAPVLRPDSNRSRGGSPLTKYQIMQNFTSGKITNEEYARQMAAIGERP